MVLAGTVSACAVWLGAHGWEREASSLLCCARAGTLHAPDGLRSPGVHEFKATACARPLRGAWRDGALRQSNGSAAPPWHQLLEQREHRHTHFKACPPVTLADSSKAFQGTSAAAWALPRLKLQCSPNSPQPPASLCTCSDQVTWPLFSWASPFPLALLLVLCGGLFRDSMGSPLSFYETGPRILRTALSTCYSCQCYLYLQTTPTECHFSWQTEWHFIERPLPSARRRNNYMFLCAFIMLCGPLIFAIMFLFMCTV